MTAKCIDISHWQGFPDFEKVHASGVIACIMKATEGTNYVDPNRAKNFVNATKAGIACCTYHWLKPGGNAREQMRYYLNKLDPVFGERVGIDYEEEGCTLDDLKEAVQALIDDPRSLKITVYSGHLLKGQLGSRRDAFLADNTDLWLAQYTTGTPSWPVGTYPEWTLWQYSETGTVPGITGAKVDLDRYNGDDESLLRWIKPDAVPKPAPGPEPEQSVSITVTAPPGVPVFVNGVRVLP